MTKRRLTLLVLTLVAAFSLGGVAYAATFTTAKANSARAIASDRPGASVFDLALGLRENATDVVDETNDATASSSCDGCRTVAIAFQVVIVQSRPTTVTPQNIALAVNEGCSGCTSLAIAHQFVVGKGEPARITSTGRRQLLAVGDDLVRLERSYERYTDAEIQARANRNAAKVRAILAAELVPIDDDGGEPDVDEDRDVDRDDD